MDVSQRRQWVSERLDPAGVDRLKLLDQPKNFVEVTLCLNILLGRQGESCQSGDSGDFLFGNGHKSQLFEE